MALSPYFTDDDVCSQLRLFFDESEQWDVDFKSFFNRVEEGDDGFLFLKVRGRSFCIDEVTGCVSEIK